MESPIINLLYTAPSLRPYRSVTSNIGEAAVVNVAAHVVHDQAAHLGGARAMVSGHDFVHAVHQNSHDDVEGALREADIRDMLTSSW